MSLWSAFPSALLRHTPTVALLPRLSHANGPPQLNSVANSHPNPQLLFSQSCEANRLWPVILPPRTGVLSDSNGHRRPKFHSQAIPDAVLAVSPWSQRGLLFCLAHKAVIPC